MPPPYYTVKFRRDTARRWFGLNPLLAEGEPGFETDTGRVKIGDGSKKWRDLEYFGGEGGGSGEDLLEHILAAEPHPAYDDGPDLNLLYQNAKV